MLAPSELARKLFACLMAVSLSLAAAGLSAEDAAPASGAQINRWILQLSDADFTTRRAAEAELLAQGATAVDALTEAAESGNRETALRCIDVLARLKESDNEETVKQATAAIEALAVSDNAPIAQRAQRLLADPPDIKQLQQNGLNRIQAIGPIQIQVQGRPLPFDANGQRRAEVEEDGKQIVIEETRGEEIVVTITETIDGEEKTTEIKAKNVQDLRNKDKEAFQLYRRHIRQGGVQNQAQIQAQAIVIGGVANRQVKVSIVNGRRTIEVEEDGKKIEIHDKDGKDISLKVTEKEGDKQETREYEAADLDELKEKHPEAAELYEKYTKQPGAAIQIQINGARLNLKQLQRRALPPQRVRPQGENDADEEAPADE